MSANFIKRDSTQTFIEALHVKKAILGVLYINTHPWLLLWTGVITSYGKFYIIIYTVIGTYS